MCGIVGGVAQRDVVAILLEGLKRLEYRGYDSAGLCVLSNTDQLQCLRVIGKVKNLEAPLEAQPFKGTIGIAHTRWATHGRPSQQNAHPHCAGNRFAVVHNGIIENYEKLKDDLIKQGYDFHSETDTEVIAIGLLAEIEKQNNVKEAILALVKKLKGAYALGILDNQHPETLFAVRAGSPLVVGKGIGEQFLASDLLALEPVADQFLYLEEGEIAEIGKDNLKLWNADGKSIQRTFERKRFELSQASKETYRHFMLKEIFEQPQAIKRTLLEADFGIQSDTIFAQTQQVQIIACGTSFYAGLIAKHWLESLAGIRCDVEIASEFRYRRRVAKPGTLVIAISQSGETADLLAALRGLTADEYIARLGICNVAESTLVRECDLVCLTKAGPEIGVASTKAFTAQLTALLLLTQKLAKHPLAQSMAQLPELAQAILALDQKIVELAKPFEHKQHALFLGRGIHFPVALEGALKLKELSYIHAEAYPAGELKHGPLALVDKQMPVVVIAPPNALLEKMKANIQEVCARDGQVFILTEQAVDFQIKGVQILAVPTMPELFSPILYTIPLQLLAYHVAILKGTDVDQPRNLAKSVTVE